MDVESRAMNRWEEIIQRVKTAELLIGFVDLLIQKKVQHTKH